MAITAIKTLHFRFKIQDFQKIKPKKVLYVANLVRGNHSLSIKGVRPIFSHIARGSGRCKNPAFSATSIRWASGPGIVIDESTLPPIPTPPTPVSSVSVPSSAEALDLSASTTEIVAQVAGEPSLASYGLCNYTPVGLVQKVLELIHIQLDVPWWGSIVIGTIILRTVVFPLVIMAQRNAASMANNLPEMQRLQTRMSDARNSGNHFESARAAQELMMFMKEKNMNPVMSMLPPLAQAPLFISMFMGLRKMCNIPVDSLHTGGILWFVDLTTPDQFYLLPVITSLTLAATIELGTDSARASQLGMMRYALRVLPIVIFPFTINFPGAILCYWVSTNFISLLQVGFLKIPKVRAYFKIEAPVEHDKSVLPANKGMVKGIKESFTNMKITRELNERAYVDQINFNKAGRAPIQRTFKYDPTKVKSTTTELLAKKKEQ